MQADVCRPMVCTGYRLPLPETIRASLAGLAAVGRDPATGLLRAAANPRGMQGYAAGR